MTQNLAQAFAKCAFATANSTRDSDCWNEAMNLNAVRPFVSPAKFQKTKSRQAARTPGSSLSLLDSLRLSKAGYVPRP
jgi:hypothetical protein